MTASITMKASWCRWADPPRPSCRPAAAPLSKASISAISFSCRAGRLYETDHPVPCRAGSGQRGQATHLRPLADGQLLLAVLVELSAGFAGADQVAPSRLDLSHPYPLGSFPRRFAPAVQSRYAGTDPLRPLYAHQG